jgi:hypothetical protein
MPYLIGRRRHGDDPATQRPQAVGTLEHARAVAYRLVEEQAQRSGPGYGSEAAATAAATAAHRLPAAGGSVGPLPDGTVITAEPVNWTDLAALAEVPWLVRPCAEILTAYNERSAS